MEENNENVVEVNDYKVESNAEFTSDSDKIETDGVFGTEGYSAQDVSGNKGMALLSYLGILAFIPYVSEKNNKWVRFHAVQGVNLFLISLIGGFVSFVPFVGWLAAPVIGLGTTILAILGIVSVCNGEAKELPIVSNFKFIKE